MARMFDFAFAKNVGKKCGASGDVISRSFIWLLPQGEG
jgi:hypothetical protein